MFENLKEHNIHVHEMINVIVYKTLPTTHSIVEYYYNGKYNGVS